MESQAKKRRRRMRTPPPEDEEGTMSADIYDVQSTLKHYAAGMVISSLALSPPTW